MAAFLKKTSLMLVATLCAFAAVSGRTLLQGSAPGEYFSVRPIYLYKRWVDIKCDEMPLARNCFAAKDAALSARWGPRKDLLFPNPTTKRVEFLSWSRYTRLLMLTCATNKLECLVPKGVSSGAAVKFWGKPIDVECMAAFAQYSEDCHNIKGADPSKCAKLSGDHCSCKGVKCSAKAVDFYGMMTCEYGPDAICRYAGSQTATSG